MKETPSQLFLKTLKGESLLFFPLPAHTNSMSPHDENTSSTSVATALCVTFFLGYSEGLSSLTYDFQNFYNMQRGTKTVQKEDLQTPHTVKLPLS